MTTDPTATEQAITALSRLRELAKATAEFPFRAYQKWQWTGDGIAAARMDEWEAARKALLAFVNDGLVPQECPVCLGKKTLKWWTDNDRGEAVKVEKTCPECEGTGVLYRLTQPT